MNYADFFLSRTLLLAKVLVLGFQVYKVLNIGM